MTSRLVLSDTNALLARHRPGVGLRTSVFATSRDDNPKAMVLAFAPGSSQPTLAVKVALTPGAAESVRREACVLRAMAELDPDRLGNVVPRLIDLCPTSQGLAMVTTAMAGRPLSTDYHRLGHLASQCRVTADFQMAARLLSRLKSLSGHMTAPTGTRPWVDQIRAVDHGAVTRDARSSLAAYAAVLGPPRESGVVHGDLWGGNLLHVGHRVTGLVDWEHATMVGDPVRDWVRFALAYSLYLDRHTRIGRPVRGHPGLRRGADGDGIRYAVTTRGWYRALIRDFVGQGLRLTGRDPSLWVIAVCAGLAEVAISSDNADFAELHLNVLRRMP